MKFPLDNFSEIDCPMEFIEDWLGATLDNAMAKVAVFLEDWLWYHVEMVWWQRASKGTASRYLYTMRITIRLQKNGM
jgi:hypothetical protein